MSEGAAGEQAMVVRCQATVDVPRLVDAWRCAAYLAFTVLLAFGGVFSVLRLNFFGICCFIAVPWAWGAFTNERAASTQEVVPACIVLQGDVLAFAFSGACLLDEELVDQRYVVVRGAVDALWFDEWGSLFLRAQELASEAWRGGDLLQTEQLQRYELSFRPDAQGCVALQRLLAEGGFELTKP